MAQVKIYKINISELLMVGREGARAFTADPNDAHQVMEEGMYELPEGYSFGECVDGRKGIFYPDGTLANIESIHGEPAIRSLDHGYLEALKKA